MKKEKRKNKNYKSMLIFFILLIGLSVGGVNASVIFSQNTNEITMNVINESYTLTTNQDDNILYVAFLDVFAPGGSDVFDSSRVSGTATYSVNGGLENALSWWSGWQYRPGFQSPWTPEDVAFLFELPTNTLSMGDTITINGMLTMNSLLDTDIILPTNIGTVSTPLCQHTCRLQSFTLGDKNAKIQPGI